MPQTGSTEATLVEKNSTSRKIEFLGLPFDNLSMSELLTEIESSVKHRTRNLIFTPNVALLIWSRKDAYLKEAYRTCTTLTVDGYAIYYAMKLLGLPIKATLSPSVFYHPLLDQADRNKYRLYLVGARPHVVQKNVEVLETDYPGIQVVGSHHGYFDPLNPPPELLMDIAQKQVDVVLVGMSTPQKEQFIREHCDDMQAAVYIGVGGMFDIMAGEAKYAPRLVRVLALEWLYRLVQEPRRLWKRYLLTNSQFLYLVFLEVLKRLFYPGTPRPKAK